MSESAKSTQAVTRRPRKAAALRLPSLEILSGDQAGTVWPLSSDCLLGRVEGCDLILLDASVSRRHARFFERDGQVWVEDLGSTNGVMLGQEVLGEARPLQEGDLLCLGDVEARYGHLSESQLAMAADMALGNSTLLTSVVTKEQFWGWLQLELTQAQDGEFQMVVEDISEDLGSNRIALVLNDVPLRRALAMAERLENRPSSQGVPDIRVSLSRGAHPTTARWSCVPIREALSAAELSRLENLPARVAHELNTPLVAVSMAVEMAAERLENPERASNLLGRALISIEQMRLAIRNLSQQTEWGE